MTDMTEQERIAKGFEYYAKVYGPDMPQPDPGASPYVAQLMQHLFAETWGRGTLSIRDRRLIVMGVLTAFGQADKVEIQFRRAFAEGELSLDELDEAVLQLVAYCGFGLTAPLSMLVPQLRAEAASGKVKTAGDSAHAGMNPSQRSTIPASQPAAPKGPLYDVAFIGLGEMGSGMCDNVIKAGHRVRVFDISAAAVAPRVELGAVAASSCADAARGADVTLVIVNNDQQVIDVVTGPQGALETMAPGSRLVVHSTISPATLRAVHDACQSKGVRLVDAGVSRGAAGTDTSTLYTMCGGAVEDFEFVRPVLDTFSRHVVRFGDVGTGMAAKLIRNLVHYITWTGNHEAQALAEAAGLDLGAFRHLINTTMVGAPDFILTRPTSRPSEAMDDEQQKWADHTLKLGYKDLDNAFALGDEVAVPTRMGHAAYDTYAEALRIP